MRIRPFSKCRERERIGAMKEEPVYQIVQFKDDMYGVRKYSKATGNYYFMKFRRKSCVVDWMTSPEPRCRTRSIGEAEEGLKIITDLEDLGVPINTERGRG